MNWSRLTAVSLCCLWSAAQAHGAYIPVDLGVLGGSGYIRAFGVNNAGTVVGESNSRSFLHNGSTMTDIGGLSNFAGGTAWDIDNVGNVIGTSDFRAYRFNGTSFEDVDAQIESQLRVTTLGSEARGMNDHGAVVGQFDSSSGTSAFYYTGEIVVDIGALLGPAGFTTPTFSLAWDVSNDREIIGYGRSQSGQTRAFLYNNLGAQMLPALSGGSNNEAIAINDLPLHRAQIVGYSGVDIGGGTITNHAFLYDRLQSTPLIDLGTLPGGFASYAFGINDLGHVVGRSEGMAGARAFLYKDGLMTDLNTFLPAGSPWNIFDAWDINDSGQIAASAVNLITGEQHAFRLDPVADAPNPVPEPGAMALAGFGILSMAAFRSRRRFRTN